MHFLKHNGPNCNVGLQKTARGPQDDRTKLRFCVTRWQI